jgi:hypothetical protein
MWALRKSGVRFRALARPARTRHHLGFELIVAAMQDSPFS